MWRAVPSGSFAIPFANSFPQPMPAGIGAAFDPASHKCSMMHSQPVAPVKDVGGPYKTKAEPIRPWPLRTLKRKAPDRWARGRGSSALRRRRCWGAADRESNALGTS